MKKCLAALLAAIGLSCLIGCANDLGNTPKAEAGYGSIKVVPSEASRKLEYSELSISSVKVYGYGKTTVTGTASALSATGSSTATIEKVTTGRRVVEVKSNKTGATLYAVADIKEGPNEVAIGWDTTAVGGVYYNLQKTVEIADIEESAFASAIDTTVHASLIETDSIAMDYKNGALKAASAYVKAAGTVTAKVFGYAGKTLKIADPASEAVKAPADGGSVTFEKVYPGVWNLYADSEKVMTVNVVSGSNSITIGSDPKSVIIYVKTSGDNIYSWGATSGVKYAGAWPGSALTVVADGMMNNPEGWKYYDISSTYDKDSINFILLSGGNKLTEDVKSGKKATFWYDGTEFYDADPTTPALPDDNTNLDDILVNGASIGVVETIEVPYKTESVTIEAKAQSAKAQVTVSPSGVISLAAGTPKEVTITVTAETGASDTYTLNVTRLEKVAGDVTLESVSVNGTSIGTLAGTSFTKALKGADSSAKVEVTATANDSESAVVEVSPKTATVADGENASFTITVTNGGKSATYTLIVSYAMQAGSQYYWTNKNGFGSNKTISSWSDWTAAEQIAQGAAYDDPRTWKGHHEVAYDVYALYAAYDDDNLYLMAELVNLPDERASFMNHNYAGSDNACWDNRDCPLGFILNTGKGATSTGPIMEKTGGPIWGSINFTDSEGFDWLFYGSSKYGDMDGKFVGVGTPGFFHIKESGEFSYDDAYCLSVNSATKKGTSGIDVHYTRKCAVSKTIYFESTPSDNRTTSKQTGEDLMASETYSSCETDSLDMSYWYTIPLATLGIDKAYIQTHGIGVRQITPNGGSLMDCCPWDPSMVDVASDECSDDPSTSHEKEDVDNITTPQARIGK